MLWEYARTITTALPASSRYLHYRYRSSETKRNETKRNEMKDGIQDAMMMMIMICDMEVIMMMMMRIASAEWRGLVVGVRRRAGVRLVWPRRVVHVVDELALSDRRIGAEAWLHDHQRHERNHGEQHDDAHNDAGDDQPRVVPATRCAGWRRVRARVSWRRWRWRWWLWAWWRRRRRWWLWGWRRRWRWRRWRRRRRWRLATPAEGHDDRPVVAGVRGTLGRVQVGLELDVEYSLVQLYESTPVI